MRDSLGAVAADAVLAELAARVRPRVPDGAAGRLRDRELRPARRGRRRAGRGARATRLRDDVERPVEVDGHRLVLRAAVGAAARPPGGDESEWLRRCDVALRAARGDAARVAVHSDELDAYALHRLDRLSQLRGGAHRPARASWSCTTRASTTREDGRLHAAEALVRWQHPVEGLLGPGAFLGLAEESGLLPEITRHVLRTVLADARRVRPERPDWQVSVNVCAGRPARRRLRRPRRRLARRSTACPPDVLRIEVTETVVMSNPERILVTPAPARRRWASACPSTTTAPASPRSPTCALLPVDELKIDRSFVTDLLDRRADELIVSSTVQLAHGLGLTVVAEGAEDADTVQRLHELDCDDVQGFALSRPVPLVDLLAGDLTLVADTRP